MNKPLVVVVWADAEDPAEGKAWLDQEDVDTFSCHSCTVESVGYLLSKTDKYVTLAADWIEDLKHYGRVTKIPSAMIVSLEYYGARQKEPPEMA